MAAAAMQPLTQDEYHGLLTCLQGALDQDSGVQKQAEAYISGLEPRPGFSSALTEVVCNREADHSARYLASVHLKNSINRSWKRKPGSNTGITPEEKAHLRTKLSQLIPQDDNQIVLQVALTYAKIARFDYPSDWPTLFHDLMANLSTGSALAVRRVYLILHHILKELSSKRLVADQANFAQVTELLFSHMWGQWCSDTQALLASLPAGLESMAAGQPLLPSFERWMLLLKILRRLILHGFPSDARTLTPVAAVHSCCPHLVAALQGMVGCRPRRRPPRSHLLAMLDRGILKLIKTQAQIQEMHPWSFHGAGVLLPMVEFCCNELMLAAAASPDQSSPSGVAAAEQRLTHCCAFLVDVMACKPYRGVVGTLDASGQAKDTGRIKALAAEVQAAMQAFWAAPFPGPQQQHLHPAAAEAGGSSRLIMLVGCLVRHHMVMNARDVEEWEDDPEEFHHANDSAAGAWQDSPSLAAEQLLLALLKAYREVLGPAMASLLPQAHAAAPPNVPAASLPGPLVAGIPMQVLYKDAVYSALAVGSYELHDYVDYRGWLAGALLQELADTGPANAPVRRRIGRVVAANVERLPADDPARPALYRGLLSLLADPNAAVALSGLDALAALVADISFDEDVFAPLLPSCLALLLRRLATSQQLDSQKQVFALINLLIERCGEALKPLVMQLAGALPQLWEQAEGQSLLRIQILEAVQRLLNLLGPDSPALYPLVLPLLQYSLNANNPEAYEGLMEDGLVLWLVALRNTPCPQPSLLQPFGALASITAESTEHLPQAMAVVTSAAVLAGPALFEAAAAQVQAIFSEVLGNVSERGMLLTFPALETLLQVAPEPAAAALQPVLTKLLGLLLAGEESSVVVANALPVLARLLLASPQHFVALCSSYAAAAGNVAPDPSRNMPADLGGAEVVLWRLLDLWTDSFDAIGQAGARRLCGLALCSALALPSRAVLGLLDGLLIAITAVWYEVEGGGEDDAGGLPPNYDYFCTMRGEEGMEAIAGPALDSEEAQGESERRARLREADPVLHVSVGAALREKLQACSQLHGAAAFQDAMGRLPDTLKQQVQAAMAGVGGGGGGTGAAA